MGWNWQTFGFVVLGIAASVLVPVLWQSVRTYFPKPANQGLLPEADRWWPLVRPYVALGAASLVTAPIVYAFGGASLDDKWQLALLAGYAWDSTLQKLK